MRNFQYILLRLMLLAITAFILSSCDQASFAAHKLKAQLRSIAGEAHEEPVPDVSMVSGVEVTRNVAYGDDKHQLIDVYAPKNAQNAPVIMTLHGGGWSTGSKDDQLSYINKVNRWVPKGFIVISVGTGLLPEADVYTQVDDLAKAVVKVQTHATEWGGDGGKVILMGHSSAGTMVSVLAANPAIVTGFGGKKWLASFVLDSSSLDIDRSMRLWSIGMIEAAYGKDQKRWYKASPINLLSNESLPMFIACSTRRGDAPCEQADLFAAEAEQFGVNIKISPQDFDHGGIDFNLGLDAEYTRAAEQFMISVDPALDLLLSASDKH